MPRRIALATAFGFTVVVTCLLLAIGATSGLLGAKKGANALANASQESAEPPEAAVADLLDAIDPGPISTPTPIVVTRVVYEDDDRPDNPAAAPRAASPPRAPLTPVANSKPSRSGPSAPISPTAAPTSAATPQPTTSSPVPPPTAVPPTVGPPTFTPPSPGATAPPTATRRPGGGGIPTEIEFQATVTAISGDMVSFSNGRVVKVTSGISRLNVGTKAQVQARLQGSVYVATEIEVQ